MFIWSSSRKLTHPEVVDHVFREGGAEASHLLEAEVLHVEDGDGAQRLTAGLQRRHFSAEAAGLQQLVS